MTLQTKPSHIFVCGFNRITCFLLVTDEILSRPFTSGNNLRVPFAFHYLWDSYNVFRDMKDIEQSLTCLFLTWNQLPILYIDSLAKFILFQRMLCGIEVGEPGLDFYSQDTLVRLLKAKSEWLQYASLKISQYELRCAIECNV